MCGIIFLLVSLNLLDLDLDGIVGIFRGPANLTIFGSRHAQDDFGSPIVEKDRSVIRGLVEVYPHGGHAYDEV